MMRIKETYSETMKKTSINVTQTKIDSIRKSNITKTGCRIYQDGIISIAGTLGTETEKAFGEAEKNLLRKIPYTYEPAKQLQIKRDLRSFTITDEEYLAKTEELLKRLREELPDFSFFNKINLIETCCSLTNDAELELIHSDRFMTMGLVCKHKDSVNVYDTSIQYSGRSYPVDEIMRQAHWQLDAYHKPAALPKLERIPIVVDFMELSGKLYESLEGSLLGKKISIFHDKIGKKVFHDDFTVYVDRTEEAYFDNFFDMEGSILTDNQSALIAHGVIQKGYSDKKNSAIYAVPNTASAGGDYDSVPTLTWPQLSAAPGSKTAAELLAGRTAIVVYMMSGGDWTNEGDFASPVHTAYLMEQGKLVGRLPQFSISGNLYDMFGKDFIGCTADKPFYENRSVVLEMKAC